MSNLDVNQSESRGFHYGWINIGVLLLVMSVSHGIISAGIPVFDARILAELNISRGALKFRDFIQIISAGLSGLAIGYAVARIPPRWITVSGLLALAVALLGYGLAPNVATIYALHVLLGFCYASVHVVIVVIFVSQWFTTHRGLAIGLALSGTSLGSAVFPQIGVALTSVLDWREAIKWLAVFPLAMAPIAAIALRSRLPSAAGHQDGSSESTSSAPSARAVDYRMVGVLGIAVFGVFYSASGFIAHTFLHLKDQGFNDQTAATGLTIVFIMGLIGKIAAGVAGDAWGTRPVWQGHQGILIASGVLLVTIQPAWFWIALVALGLGWAGCYTLTQVVLTDMFAGPSLGKLIGWFIVFEAVGAGSGSWLTGVLFDAFGSYSIPFMINTALLLVSFTACFFLPKRR